MPERDRPYLSVRLANVGHGDPLCPDEGLGWYDVHSEQGFAAGTYEVDGLGRSLTQFIPGVGTCLRAFCIPQDTRLTHGTASGGSWEEERLSTGGRRNYRVSQYDSANTVTSWSWTNDSQPHPANPSLAFSLILDDTPSDWDFATYAPFVRIELGGEYGIQFTKEGAFLMRFLGGAWTAVADLPNPPKGAYAYDDAEECWIWLRVLDGNLCISVDHGRTYHSYGPPGEAAYIPAGNVTLRGRGGTVTFGMHQLRCYDSDWDSTLKALEQPRTAGTVNFDASRYELNGGGLTLSDLGVPLASVAQYRAAFTAGVSAGLLWDWYTSPVLAAVAYDLEPVVETTGDTWTTPWEEQLLRGRLVKPPKLDGTWGEFTFSANAEDTLDLDAESYRWRLLELWFGWWMSDGTIESYRAIRGHIETITVSWGEELSKVLVTVKIANASARFKRSPWTPFRQFILSGRTPNAAADFVLARKGLGPTYRNWHLAGAMGVIPLGSAREPNELTPAQELPWETLERIFAERGLELGVDDDGVIFTLPQNYVAASVTLTVGATSALAASIWAQAKRVSYTIDFKESATCALAYGTNARGEQVLAMTHDDAAERNTASPRFTMLGRETRLRELPGTPDQGLCVGHAQALAGESFRLHKDADFVIPMDPTRSRRELVELVGFAGCGIPDNTQFVLLTLETTCDVTAGNLGLETVGGIKRLDD